MSTSFNQEQLRFALKFELKRLKDKNSSYSLRALARSLGLSPALLSKFLNSQCQLGTKSGEKVNSWLEIRSVHWKQYLQDSAKYQMEIAQRLKRERSADWHYLAVLHLQHSSLKFQKPSQMSSHLCVPEEEVLTALTYIQQVHQRLVTDYYNRYVRLIDINMGKAQRKR